MHSKLKGFAILLLGLTLAAVPRALSSPEKDSPQETKGFQKPYGGTLVIGHNNAPTLINPILTDSSVSMSITTLIFNRLVRYDSEGGIRPDLAESWDVSPDGLTYTFHLRHNVRFHDGVELTAEDIVYTYSQIREINNHSPYFRNMNLIKHFEALDRYTFRVDLVAPSASFLYALIREIAPKHIYEKEDLRSGAFNKKPIGTGPFRFKDWGPNNQITLEANPDYFEGHSFLDAVVYKLYPTDAEVWSALMRGEVDLVEFLSVENYEITRRDPSFKTYANPTSDYYLISYNMGDPLMSDRKIRFAVACSLDMEGLIRSVENDHGVQATGPFSAKTWAYDKTVKPFVYDPPKAVEILKEDGWKDSNNDGILDRDGAPLIIRMLVNAKDQKLKKMATFIRQNLQEVGIKLEIRLYDDVKEAQQLTSSGGYQAALTFFLGPNRDPHEIIKFWYSMDKRTGILWPSKVQNPGLDQLIREAEVAYDKSDRQRIYHDIHRLIYEEQLACFLYFPFDFHAVSKKLGGTDPFLGSVYMPDNLIKDFYMNTGNRSRRR